MTTDSPIVHIAVTQLMAAFGQTLDHGDAKAWSQLFTSTGCFVLGDISVVGHEALEEYANHAPPGIHIAGQPVITEATREGCRVTSSYLFHSSATGKVVAGYYDDQLVLIGGRPHFAIRAARVNGQP